MKKNLFLFTAVSSILFFSLANAATLALYNFNDNTTNDSASASDLTAGAISTGAGLTGTPINSNGSNSYNDGVITRTLGATSTAWDFDSPLTETNEEAITDQRFITFTITADANRFLNLTELSFLHRAKSLTRGTSQYTVYSDVATNFADFDANILTNSDDNILGTGSLSASSSYETQTVNLDIPALQGLSDITFRIYLHGQTVANNTNSFTGIDNITLTGSVVPEPSSLALLLLASSSCLFMRSRKSSSKKAA